MLCYSNSPILGKRISPPFSGFGGENENEETEKLKAEKLKTNNDDREQKDDKRREITSSARPLLRRPSPPSLPFTHPPPYNTINYPPPAVLDTWIPLFSSPFLSSYISYLILHCTYCIALHFAFAFCICIPPE